MNLHSHDPYWLMKSGMVTTYPSLQQDLKTDVVVIGAGRSQTPCRKNADAEIFSFGRLI